MGSNKEAQAARSAADRRLREAHRDEWEALMTEEHAKRGLAWSRRATPEERAERERLEREAKVRARIEREAEKLGMKVNFVPVETEPSQDTGEYVHPVDDEAVQEDEGQPIPSWS
jgi:hypothetical protein